MDPPELPLWEAVDRIRERNPRFRREAYGFLVASLGITIEGLPPERRGHPERRHLTGREVLRGMITLARLEFGALAPTVFREWGLVAPEDVGTMVFELVENRQLSARPEDSLEDFRSAIDVWRDLSGGEREPSRSPYDA
jgi:uncharacterized repeat protein (TIGR04138 family)